MSNLDKAAQVVYESCYGRNLHPGQVGSIVRGLNDAGLLMPDLPGPDADEEDVVGWEVGYHVQRADYSTGAWSEVEVPTGQVWTETDGAIGMDVNHDYFYMDTVDAKKIALAILAACEYAEKMVHDE